MLALLPTYIFAVVTLFSSTDVSKCDIRKQGVYEDYILRFNAKFH